MLKKNLLEMWNYYKYIILNRIYVIGFYKQDLPVHIENPQCYFWCVDNIFCVFNTYFICNILKMFETLALVGLVSHWKEPAIFIHYSWLKLALILIPSQVCPTIYGTRVWCKFMFKANSLLGERTFIFL